MDDSTFFKSFIQADPLIRTGAIIGYYFSAVLAIILLFFILKIYYSRFIKDYKIKNSTIALDVLFIIIIDKGIRYLVMQQVEIFMASYLVNKINAGLIETNTLQLIVAGLFSIISIIATIGVILYIFLKRIILFRKTENKANKLKDFFILILYLLIGLIIFKIIYYFVARLILNSNYSLYEGFLNYKNYLDFFIPMR